MADELTSPLSAGAEILGPLATEERSATGMIANDDIARRLRAWYLEAITHPKWVKYIKESAEDQRYYVGGEGQWEKEGSKEDLERLKALGRAVITVNHIKPIVDVLVGFERQNRFDIKAVPQGIEDDEDARILSWLLKFVQDQAEVPETISEGFKGGLICGARAYDVRIDWTSDPVNGEIVIDVLKPGVEVLWDPYAKRYDKSDGAYFLRFQWVRLQDLIAMFPEHKDRIEGAMATYHPLVEAMAPTTTDGPAGDAYGSVTSHPIETGSIERQFYDPALRRLLILEGQYMTYEAQWVVTDKVTGKVEEFDDAATARAFATGDKDHLTAIRRLRRKVMTATVIPATQQTLEEGDTPYDNDASAYSIVPFIADEMDDEMLGVVRNLKDPQRVENKRISQSMDLVARFGNLRLWAEENSLANPEAVTKAYSTDVIWVRPGKRPPGFIVPEGIGQLVNMLVELSQQMKMAPREISGINSDLLGIKGDTSSGIAIARRQAQGQTIAAPYFDNLRRTRKLIGQRLARRIQQRFSTADTLRLIDDAGQAVQVQLNPPEFKGLDRKEFEARMAGMPMDPARPKILRDLSALKFDVVISESPATPTARQQALLAALDFLDKAPDLWPAFVETILELADLPNRQKILSNIRALQAAPAVPGALPGGGPPPPGGPAPVPAPPAVPAPPPMPMPRAA